MLASAIAASATLLMAAFLLLRCSRPATPWLPETTTGATSGAALVRAQHRRLLGRDPKEAARARPGRRALDLAPGVLKRPVAGSAPITSRLARLWSSAFASLTTTR